MIGVSVFFVRYLLSVILCVGVLCRCGMRFVLLIGFG